MTPIEDREPVWDDEDTSNDEVSFVPWDPSKIRISTKNFSLREIVSQIQSDDIDLTPDFQREFVWGDRQQTRLIESIMLGIPLPAFYFNQDLEGYYQVIDGVQRLSTIELFMSDKLRLQQKYLEYLKGLDNYNFSEFDIPTQRRFKSSQIVVHIIEPQTPDEIKYDIFNRVNTLGTPLSAQEIRHAMSKPRSRGFLSELVNFSAFDFATDFSFWRTSKDGTPLKDTNRMMNRELGLRFCAFSYHQNNEYRSFPSMDSYLVEFLRKVDGRSSSKITISDDELNLLKHRFENAMINAYEVLGHNAFRRLGQSKKRGPLNRAIFESQALALADLTLETARKHKVEIQVNLLELFSDEEYVRSVTVGTGAAFRVEYRLMRAKLAVEAAIV